MIFTVVKRYMNIVIPDLLVCASKTAIPDSGTVIGPGKNFRQKSGKRLDKAV
jgi:hypothetical protein